HHRPQRALARPRDLRRAVRLRLRGGDVNHWLAAWFKDEDRQVALALFVLGFAVLLATQGAVGIPRDESFYFYAATNQAGWWRLLFSSPSHALEDGAIVQAFGYNSEHPTLMKNLFALSW